MRNRLTLMIVMMIFFSSCKQSKIIVRKMPNTEELKKLFDYGILCHIKTKYTSPKWVSDFALTEVAKPQPRVEYLDQDGNTTLNKTPIRRTVTGVLVDYEVQGYPLYDGISKGNLAITRQYAHFLIRAQDAEDLKQFKHHFLPFQLKMVSDLKPNQYSDSERNFIAQSILHQIPESELIVVPDHKKHTQCEDTPQKLCLIPIMTVPMTHWDVKAKKFLPMWQVKFADGRPEFIYLASAVDRGSHFEFLEITPLFHSLTGKASVYANNTTEEVKEVEIPNMSNDSPYLCSDSFVTKTPTDSPQAVSTSHEFFYDPGSQEFGEVNLFQTLMEFERWLVDVVGFVPWANTPILVQMFSDFSPQYTNPDIGANSSLGPSDGVDYQREVIIMPPSYNGGFSSVVSPILDKLWFDKDPVRHERGHGVMYGFLGLGNGTYEHCCLKEAIPDIFLFLYPDSDACLGERICVPGQGGCFTETCLRTAENSIKYNDNNYQNYADASNCHKNSQLISGFIWDLVTKQAVPKNEAAQLVYKSLSYMQASTNFSDFINSLLAAEAAKFKGKYLCQIIAAARGRNLSSFIESKYVCTKK